MHSTAREEGILGILENEEVFQSMRVQRCRRLCQAKRFVELIRDDMGEGGYEAASKVYRDITRDKKVLPGNELLKC